MGTVCSGNVDVREPRRQQLRLGGSRFTFSAELSGAPMFCEVHFKLACRREYRDAGVTGYIPPSEPARSAALSSLPYALSSGYLRSIGRQRCET